MISQLHGLVWKGSKLRVERAREDFAAKQRRQHDADAAAAAAAAAPDTLSGAAALLAQIGTTPPVQTGTVRLRRRKAEPLVAIPLQPAAGVVVSLAELYAAGSKRPRAPRLPTRLDLSDEPVPSGSGAGPSWSAIPAPLPASSFTRGRLAELPSLRPLARAAEAAARHLRGDAASDDESSSDGGVSEASGHSYSRAVQQLVAPPLTSLCGVSLAAAAAGVVAEQQQQHASLDGGERMADGGEEGHVAIEAAVAAVAAAAAGDAPYACGAAADEGGDEGEDGKEGEGAEGEEVKRNDAVETGGSDGRDSRSSGPLSLDDDQVEGGKDAASPTPGASVAGSAAPSSSSSSSRYSSRGSDADNFAAIDIGGAAGGFAFSIGVPPVTAPGVRGRHRSSSQPGPAAASAADSSRGGWGWAAAMANAALSGPGAAPAPTAGHSKASSATGQVAAAAAAAAARSDAHSSGSDDEDGSDDGDDDDEEEEDEEAGELGENDIAAALAALAPQVRLRCECKCECMHARLETPMAPCDAHSVTS